MLNLSQYRAPNAQRSEYRPFSRYYEMYRFVFFSFRKRFGYLRVSPRSPQQRLYGPTPHMSSTTSAVFTVPNCWLANSWTSKEGIWQHATFLSCLVACVGLLGLVAGRPKTFWWTRGKSPKLTEAPLPSTVAIPQNYSNLCDFRALFAEVKKQNDALRELWQSARFAPLRRLSTQHFPVTSQGWIVPATSKRFCRNCD